MVCFFYIKSFLGSTVCAQWVSSDILERCYDRYYCEPVEDMSF